MKYYLKLSLTLAITCVIVAGLLGYVNSITKDTIEEHKAEATATAMSAVMEDPSSEFTQLEVSEDMTASGTEYATAVKAVYEVAGGGYVVEVVPTGFGGDIDMVVGLNADATITGVSIISNAETAGVGTKVMENQPNADGVNVLEQFVGQAGPFVVKDNMTPITGATVSSKAVTRGVNAALSAVATIG